MTNDQIRRLLAIGEEALRKAQDVFRDQPQVHDPEDLAEVWARLLAVFEAAPNGALTVDQVSATARALGVDPRGVGALYNDRLRWLRTDGDMRVITDEGRDWLNTMGRVYLKAVEDRDSSEATANAR